MGNMARNGLGGHKVKEREIIPAQRWQQQYSELAVLVIGQHRVICHSWSTRLVVFSEMGPDRIRGLLFILAL